MEDYEKVKSALDAVDASSLNYQEWTQVGMAIKDAGLPCSLWELWSARDTLRYHQGECRKKWETFEGSGVTVATLYSMAMDRGWGAHRNLDWYEEFESEGLDVDSFIAQHIDPEKAEPWQQAVKYLEAIFEPDEYVSYVVQARLFEDGKWKPANSGNCSRTRKELVTAIKRYKDLGKALGDWTEEAGAWIRFNPTDGQGGANKNTTRFTYALVESDTMSLEDQKKALVRLNLPIAALVNSGSKSLHAIVHVDASTPEEYSQRVKLLYDELGKHGMQMDTQNSNSARLSRFPGVTRNGVVQELIALDMGAKSWDEWRDFMAGIDDDLPPLITLADQLADPPELSPELITGILREGCKMIITGDSKAGKTCLSQNLAVCIAEGRKWLGRFDCQQGKVLYINLEVESAALFYRFKAMYKAMGIKISDKGGANIVPWNLRGYAAPIDKLAPKIIKRCRNSGPYKAIIIDPLYKVQQGDENSAQAISDFCNALDKIAHDTGAAVIYDHHHPKGTAGEKKVIDRGAGSGVFSRDADALVDISNLDPGNDASDVVKALVKDGERPMVMSFALRDFKDIEEQKIWFNFPLHYIDEANVLENCHIEGSAEANFSKNPNRKSADEKRRIVEFAFEQCQRDGIARLTEMEQYAEVKARTLRDYAVETGLFEIGTGYIKRKDISG